MFDALRSRFRSQVRSDRILKFRKSDSIADPPLPVNRYAGILTDCNVKPIPVQGASSHEKTEKPMSMEKPQRNIETFHHFFLDLSSVSRYRFLLRKNQNNDLFL